MNNRFTVIMPTYNQAGFIRRAIQSLLNQTLQEWELIIINDGSTDATCSYVTPFLADKRFTYVENKQNKGIGASINQALDMSKYEYIAYLPSDDFYYPNHLQVLKDELDRSKEIVLAYTKCNAEIQDTTIRKVIPQINGLFYQHCLQLVQTAHRNTTERWIERDEWVSCDFFQLFWTKLTCKGFFSFVNIETSYWASHPLQHHKIIAKFNWFRQYYRICTPLRIRSFKFRFIDEVDLYQKYRGTRTLCNDRKLKILLVGELSYHPERICALEEYGCELYGLWMRKPTHDFSAVGPLPFGNVIDIPYENWETEIRKVKPDIIYAGVNIGAEILSYEVMKKCPDIPFVWHFKEGPFLSMQYGTWDNLMELYDKSDGKIYINEESQRWYEQFVPRTGLSFILDADMPKIDYFSNNFSPRLSETDGAIHTVIPGRVVGLKLDDINILASLNIHIHSYGNYLANYNREYLKAAPAHFHVHPYCKPADWVNEFSKYDAGWLHPFNSNNDGNYLRIGWDDLNMPARMGTFASAALPMILKNNEGHIVAMQTRIGQDNLGVFYKDLQELGSKLYDKSFMNMLRANVLAKRETFSFDYYVPQLIDFFIKVINSKKQ